VVTKGSSATIFNDNANLFDAACEALFDNHLDGGFDEAILINDGEHFLLDGAGCREHPGSAPGGSDDGFSYSHGV
jgi:hypothetical protein